MIYRALKDLDTGKRIIKQGDVFPSVWLKNRAIPILEEGGKIAPASLPPLAAMPQYKKFAKKFLELDIETAGDLLEADDMDCAKIMRVSESDVRMQKSILYAMFATPVIRD